MSTPSTAGYSGTPLLKKLGLKAGMRAAFVDAPPHYADLLGALPEGTILLETPDGEMDFIHFFALTQEDLETRFTDLKRHLAPTGMLWISWPKKASSIETDLSSNLVRSTGLAGGLVDVKVCAVDADWSALKFVYRLKDR
ncbi:MAG TPA: hypothetical protein VKP65_02870 [Rhodothermales bacterium]|nr:hypothetical protein [Rhodothermales bacterium]